jgi:hypothetical protein
LLLLGLLQQCAAAAFAGCWDDVAWLLEAWQQLCA